jgi:hypothetical protein
MLTKKARLLRKKTGIIVGNEKPNNAFTSSSVARLTICMVSRLCVTKLPWFCLFGDFFELTVKSWESLYIVG